MGAMQPQAQTCAEWHFRVEFLNTSDRAHSTQVHTGSDVSPFQSGGDTNILLHKGIALSNIVTCHAFSYYGIYRVVR